jgi:4-hydroxythreonine-4-phosphate dehydrogenase
MKRIAISVGDLNGIGLQLALEHHAAIRTIAEPIYCIDRAMLKQGAELLGRTIPDDFRTVEPFADPFTIRPGTVDAASGAYSYGSFVHAVALTRAGIADAVTTLPIHKKAWQKAGIEYTGHTDALRDWFDAEAIMMLGCPEMYVALYTEHIPLRTVSEAIDEERLTRFLLDFYRTAQPENTVAVLGLNPHAGDDGVIGDEERIIERAIYQANQTLTTQHPTPNTHHSPFTGPIVPDIAFTPAMRARYTHYVAMYHDQGLAPLKALYFDAGINVSLNLPILRTSVDHGTAFDKAYRNEPLSGSSYRNAVTYAARNAPRS